MQKLRETAMKLQEILANFGVNVTVTNVSCGPAVTRYELQPEMGVKVSKICRTGRRYQAEPGRRRYSNRGTDSGKQQL